VLRLTLKTFLGHKVRFLLTGLAVTLGVAFMGGTLVYGDTLQRGLDSIFSSTFDGTDAVVRAPEAFETDWGDQREPVSTDLARELLAVPGVASAEPSVQGYAQLIDADGKPVGNPGNGPPTFGGNWMRVDRLNPWRIQEGRPPVAPDEVVIDRRSAEQGGFAVGDTVSILTKVPPQEFHLVGIALWGEAESPLGASAMLFSRETAERLVGTPGKANLVQLAAAPGWTEQELRTSLLAHLEDRELEVVTGAEMVAEGQESMQRAFGFFDTFLLVFALIALFVGSFIIFNTFSIVVAQRTRELALMRAIGASRRQVLASVLLEAVIVALVASAVGLAFGVLLAVGLRELLASFGIDIPGIGLVVNPGSLAVAFVAGAVVTVVAAVFPARRAASVPPLAAMRDVATGSTGHTASRVAAGAAMVAAGGAAVAAGLFGDMGQTLRLVGGGAVVVFLGVAVLGPALSRPLVTALGAPLRLRGVTGVLATQNAQRNPKRTSATAAALMVGVAVVSLIAIVAESAKAAVRDMVETSEMDFLIGTQSMGFGGFTPAVSQRVSALPEVEVVTGLRMGQMQVEGRTRQVMGIHPRGFAALWDVQPVAGDVSRLSDSGVAISKEVAADQDLEVGDLVRMTFARTGEDLFRVEVIFGNSQRIAGFILNTHAYDRNFVQPLDTEVWVKLAEGVGLEEGRTAIERVLAGYPNLQLQDQDDVIGAISDALDQMLGLVYALLALAVVIAFIGIANTLALSIHERTRELGLLRAVGLTRGQLRAVVRWEAVMISLLGAVLGIGVGVAFGGALVAALESEGMNRVVLPGVQLVAVVVVAWLAGLVAALRPSRRAAKLDVLRAIHAD